MTDEQFERLLAVLGRLATTMEGLLVVNTALLNAVTVDDSEQIETKVDPLSTMDG